MKLQGSRRVMLQCLECEQTSEPFYVTLVEDDFNGNIWLEKTKQPINWDVPDEAELNEDIIYAYCPKHKVPNPLIIGGMV